MNINHAPVERLRQQNTLSTHVMTGDPLVTSYIVNS